MDVRFCPPPDLTRLEDNILHVYTIATCPALDDNQLEAFFRNKYWSALHSKKLYNILKKEIQPLTDKQGRDLSKWQKIDISVTNADALPEFVEFAHEVGKHALVQDNMLRGVIYNFTKILGKGNDVDNASSKVNCELIKLFRTKFDNNMKMFPFSLKDNEILIPFAIHSVILFAIQIRSLYEDGEVRVDPRAVFTLYNWDGQTLCS
jgi:hypothetical protein